MADVVKVINLIKSDVEKNNNKFWRGTLYSSNDVLCEWGRVGDKGQSKLFPGAGLSFLEKKANEKKRDGRNGEIAYREIEIIGGSTAKNASGASVSNASLQDIAKKQIVVASKSKETVKLIDFLTQINVHNITSFSNQFTYNVSTGLFQTPMGLVGQSTIDEARDKLSEIHTLISKKDFGKTMKSLTNDYLMLIPQTVSRTGVVVTDFWGEANKVQQQNSVLDALQASLATAAKPTGASTNTVVEEKVFDTELDIVTDQSVIKRLFDNFHRVKSSQHSGYHYKPVNVWEVNIKSMRNAFNNDGKKLSNNIEGYHGTGSENILSLLKTGFLVKPPKNAVIAGKMFGCGTYTAPCHIKGSSTKALNYAIGNWGGRKSSRTFMFICDVGMGKFYTPPGPCSGIPKEYDSCWAKGDYKSGVLNDECIVYRESQIDIKYLMELEG